MTDVARPPACTIAAVVRLSPAQRRHLEELRLVALGKSHGEAYWYPTGSGEHRTAEALARRGLLTREYVGTACYRLTDAGLAAASPEGS